MIIIKKYRVGALAALLTLGLAIVSGAAFAGAKATMEVTFTIYPDGSSMGMGALGAAYNSTDNRQSVGCWNSPGIASCIMTDRSGTTKACALTDSDFVSTIRSLTPDSLLILNWDTAGNCTGATVNTWSNYRPKKP